MVKRKHIIILSSVFVMMVLATLLFLQFYWIDLEDNLGDSFCKRQGHVGVINWVEIELENVSGKGWKVKEGKVLCSHELRGEIVPLADYSVRNYWGRIVKEKH